ncbi:MAG: hypothetical protein ACU85V_15095 [Gammaproteobacteria bacterium]
MSASHVSFSFGVATAAALALGTALLAPVLELVLPGAAGFKLLVAALGGGYLLALGLRTGLRTGRIALPLAWLLAALLIALTVHSAVTCLVLHALLVWLGRACLWHASLLSALLDLGLTLLALLAAVGASLHSGSAPLAVWTFFLASALFVLIPRHWVQSPAERNAAVSARFERASSRAEAAVSRLGERA